MGLQAILRANLVDPKARIAFASPSMTTFRTSNLRIYLAPMEGVVDYHMRNILARVGGLDLCVTEFVRVTDHVLPKRVFTKYCPELLSSAVDSADADCHSQAVPTRIQLLGSNPMALALNAKKAARLGAVGIDLNFGCPAKTVNKNRGGACLLDETDLLGEIVHAVRCSVPTDVPVTAKIRLGYQDRDSYLRNAQIIEQAGANELAVHARSKADGYNPPAFWHYIGEIRNTLAIPVIANGEIWNVSDFEQCKRQSECSDFMLGRGMLANPALARSIKSFEEGGDTLDVPWSEVVELLHAFFLSTSKAYPVKFMGNRVKQWLHYLQLNYAEAKHLFNKIKRLKDYEKIERNILESKYY